MCQHPHLQLPFCGSDSGARNKATQRRKMASWLVVSTPSQAAWKQSLNEDLQGGSSTTWGPRSGSEKCRDSADSRARKVRPQQLSLGPPRDPEGRKQAPWPCVRRPRDLRVRPAGAGPHTGELLCSSVPSQPAPDRPQALHKRAGSKQPACKEPLREGACLSVLPGTCWPAVSSQHMAHDARPWG